MRSTLAMCVGLTLALTGACDQIHAALPQPALDGASLVIEIDSSAATDRQLEALSEQMADVLRSAGVRYTGRGVIDNAVRIRLIDPTESDRALAALAPITGHLTMTSSTDGLIEGRYTDFAAAQARAQLTEASIPILERRLAGLRAGVEANAPGRLLVRTGEPVVPEAVKYVISRQGLITFHLVREVAPEQWDGRAPVGAMLVQPFFEGDRAEVVSRRPELTGERLARANVSTDPQTGQFALSFALDADGARRFCQITNEHTGERFAILLDGQVLTAPTINEPICGGSGQISGNFTAESANDLAIMLRAGALPAPFRIVEELPPGAP